MKSVPLQSAVVVTLFLGSLAALLINVVSAWGLPRQELEARINLREASRRMASQAAAINDLKKGPKLGKGQSDRLREITASVLREFSGVEGGFYRPVGKDAFVGFAFPTAQPPPARSDPIRNEPPPLEAPFILSQARESLSLATGEVLVRTQDIGPSRVIILTEPVGISGPAALVTWLMYRLVGPEQLENRARRYLVATLLALGGMSLALLLTWNLARTLKSQRREQEQLRDDLRRSEHLATLGRLLAGVAHEVRNPLAAIRSTVQLWQRLPDRVRAPESLDAVIDAVDRVNAIVGRLLYFSRAENTERAPVDINLVLKDVLSLVQAQATAQEVLLETDLAAHLPAVWGSAPALRQVATNLLTNALQAMPAGGCLRTRTRFLASDNLVEFVVADTGPGITPEVRAHLFEPFFTTRPEGTGLGLALCREIVMNHGGRIECVQGDSPGAAFQVLLPVKV